MGLIEHCSNSQVDNNFLQRPSCSEYQSGTDCPTHRMGKRTQGKTNEDTLYSKNQCLPDQDNKISESRVHAQLARAPEPTDKRKSGYPHPYMNKGGIILRRESTESTSYYEYPVTQSGPDYDFDSKPKQNPGPYRGIVNQKKDYRATICHDGEVKNGENFPNGGHFHLCNKNK